MAVFSAMESYAQFILHRNKIPLDPISLKPGDPHDSKNWLQYRHAEMLTQIHTSLEIGFVFTDNDPFFFLDIDHCIDNGKMNSIAEKLITLFDGAAVEVSRSKNGIHIFGTYDHIDPHACKNADLNIELYHTRRFAALTGFEARGDASQNKTVILNSVISEFFKNDNSTVWESAGIVSNGNSESDEELIQRALNSKSAKSVFTNSVCFRDLWEGNIESLSRAYPPKKLEHAYNHSSADAALAQHLAFWTGNDEQRIRQLMYKSKLAREKWTSKRGNVDYLSITITNATKRQTTFYTTQINNLNQTEIHTENSNTSETDCTQKALYRTDSAFLSAEQQINHFKNCIYVKDEHKILVPGGQLLTADRFKAIFGSKTFVMDAANSRTTRNAFECFTESQLLNFPKADTTCFKPALKPMEIENKNGISQANIWYPPTIECEAGDVIPFLNHLSSLYPNEEDQKKLLYYFAALVQHQGIKFRWCPVLQGVEGNGKSLLSRIVAYAIGERYVHFAQSKEIAARFNGWLYAKTLVIIDDVYIPSSKADIIEAVKPMIDSDRLEIEPKGGEKITRDVCANFILSTNHKDGIRKTEETRRFAMFFSHQQSREQLIRSGLDEKYFRELVMWLRIKGFKYTTHYLKNLEIPDKYNPAVESLVAPFTSSTVEAVNLSVRTPCHDELIEAIESNRVGFRGGYISSTHLLALMKEARIYIHAQGIQKLLNDIGYVLHPALTNGRASRIPKNETVQPRIYIHREKVEEGISPSEAVRDYENAQYGS